MSIQIRLLPVLLILLGFFGCLYADSDYFMGTEIGARARSIRLANVEGFSFQSDSVLENPAGLARVESGSMTLFSSTLMGEVQYYNGTIAAATPVGVFGLGFNSVGVSGLVRTQEVFESGLSVPEELGNFGVTKTVYKVGYGFSQSPNLKLGVSGALYLSTIDTYTASGFNLDAGVLFEEGRAGLSFLIRNLANGLNVKYSDGSEESLPMESVVGGKLGLGDFDVFGQIKVVGSSKKLAKSAAINYNPGFVPFINLSVGYKEYLVLREVQSNTVMGIGVEAFGTEFDYAYEHSDHPEFSGNHYFSIGVSF